MMDSRINWKQVAYAVGGCWLIFALLYLLGISLRLPLIFYLSPFPIVVKAIFGGLVYGYVGSTSGTTLKLSSSTGRWWVCGCLGGYTKASGNLQ
jgi:hypothetical protein